MTKIEWTDATWNPIVGCSVTSPGCTNCYAMKMAGRLEGMAATNASLAHYVGTTQRSKAGFVWTGKVNMAPDSILTAPLRRRKPTRYFVNSMADLFHESVPDEWIDRVFAVMALAPQHTFQVLTKRSARMRDYLQQCDWFCGPREPGRVASNAALLAKQLGLRNVRLEARWPLPNVWLGVSVEDQARADERIPDLLATPAAVRFLSCEPLLGPVDLRAVQWGHSNALNRLDWVIAGGESGPGARPMHPDWVRSLRDQCAAADVPFFFKQWGEWGHAFHLDGCFGVSAALTGTGHWPEPKRYRVQGGPFDGATAESHPDDHLMLRIGKARAGRLLDGREWSQFPA